MHHYAQPLLMGLLISLSAAASAADGPAPVAVEECVIRFAEVVDVPALDAGPVVEVAVEQNQEVQAGQRLARLDDRSLAIQRRAAELKRQIAQQKVEDELETRFAETAYQEAVEELESNRAVYDASSGAVPLSTLRRLRLAVERANLERERVRKLRSQAEIQLQLQMAELEAIDDHLRRLSVESPISGVVLSIDRRPGEWVAKGEAVAKIARLDRLHVQALVSEESLSARRALGARVSVRWTEDDQEYSLGGHVASIDPQRLSGRQYRLHATIENRATKAGWLLLPGREVEMTIEPVDLSAAQAARERAAPSPLPRVTQPVTEPLPSQSPEARAASSNGRHSSPHAIGTQR